MDEQNASAQWVAVWDVYKGRLALVYWGEGAGVRALVKILDTVVTSDGEVRLIGWWISQNSVLNIPASQVTQITLGAGVEQEGNEQRDDTPIVDDTIHNKE